MGPWEWWCSSPGRIITVPPTSQALETIWVRPFMAPPIVPGFRPFLECGGVRKSWERIGTITEVWGLRTEAYKRVLLRPRFSVHGPSFSWLLSTQCSVLFLFYHQCFTVWRSLLTGPATSWWFREGSRFPGPRSEASSLPGRVPPPDCADSTLDQQDRPSQPV